MKYPKKIKIGAYMYDVAYEANLKIDEGFRACVNFRTHKILIDPAQSDTQKSFTLLHEIMHIINNNYECDLDESNISRIANGILEFLQDNLGIKFEWDE